MEIKINGKNVTLPEDVTLADALNIKGINATGIATALNGTVISISDRSATKLKDGDSILIIKAFYGG